MRGAPLKSLRATVILTVTLTAAAAWAGQVSADRDTRIIGGSIAPNGKWPAQVALVDENEPDNYSAQFCAGTLIHKRFVLTAAHCLSIEHRDFAVLVGTQSLEKGGKRVMPSRFWRHPLYERATANNDVALIELEADVSDIKPALMIALAEEPTLAAHGDEAVVTGWGYTGGNYSARLREATVPVVRRDICNRPTSYDGRVTEKMMCAGDMKEGGVDTCHKDSGGPLWVKNHAGDYIVAGVTSWGQGCAQPRYPGVYARLAVLRRWINETIRKFSQ